MKLHFIYKIAGNGVAEAYIRRHYRIKTKKYQLPEGANLIVSNHVTNLDFLIIESVTRCKPIHIVLADNLVKKKLIRKLFIAIIDPIIHVKGSNAMWTSKDMFRRLQAGQNVLIFPEGNTTYDGCTAASDHTLGMMARLSGANLVMMKIKGGYFTKPRWRDKPQKGEVNVECTILTNDELQKLMPEDMAKAMNTALYTDAYEEQEQKQIAFRGKNPCLGLERAIYQCPACKKTGGLKTSSKEIFCTCGYKESMDDFGYLSNDAGRHTITEYVRGQRAYLTEHFEEFCFEDEVDIYSIVNLQRELLGKYKLTVNSKEICYEKVGSPESGRIATAEIKNATIYQAHTFNVYTEEKGYEIIGDFSFNALKYRDAFEILNKRN